MAQPAIVSVPVACAWRSPEAPRAIDAAALAPVPDVRAWLAGMDDDQKRDLVGRLETQVLLGERVVVEQTVDGWARVSIPGQPAVADGVPYSAWVRAAHLESVEEDGATSSQVATVVAPMAVLQRDGAPWEVSFGTSLPVTAVSESGIEVGLPGGGRGTLRGVEVVLHANGTPALPASAGSVIDRARAFVGLPYLWAGRSGFGFDCSGLVQLVHQVHGITLPRDTGPMSEFGREVTLSDRAPGDLVFFERNGDVHHVVTWIGSGLVVESPKTGLAARVIELEALPYAGEVTVTRRVLTG